MTPPKASLSSDLADKELPLAGCLRLGTPSKIEVIQKRADFLRASRAPRVAMQGFVLQINEHPQKLTNKVPECRVYGPYLAASWHPEA